MRKLLLGVPLLLCAAMLSGCGVIGFNNPALDPKPEVVVVDENGNPVDVSEDGEAKAASDFLDGIGHFAYEDIKQAAYLAGDQDFDGVVEQVGGDALANQCWFYLGGKLADAKDGPVVTISGIASALQFKRNMRRNGGLGVSDEFKAACGGLLMDVRSQIRKRGLGLLTGGILG